MLECELGDVEFKFLAVKGVALFGQSKLPVGKLQIMGFRLGVFVALEPLARFGEGIRGHGTGGDLVRGVEEGAFGVGKEATRPRWRWAGSLLRRRGRPRTLLSGSA